MCHPIYLTSALAGQDMPSVFLFTHDPSWLGGPVCASLSLRDARLQYIRYTRQGVGRKQARRLVGRMISFSALDVVGASFSPSARSSS